MATQAQIAANRANAQKSTGPSSAEGKAASRFNALKHGIDAESVILPGEDPAAYQDLVAEYHRDFAPQTGAESFYVETMIRAEWQKRRLIRVEADLYRTILAEAPGATLATALLSNTPAVKLLARVQRELSAHIRTWLRAITELRRSRKPPAPVDDSAPVNLLQPPLSPARVLASFPRTGANPDRTPGNPALRL